MKNSFYLLILMLVLGATGAIADPPAKPRDNSPITIKSNTLLGDTKKKTATFIGRVVAKQNDITIYCDKLVVFYAEQGGQVDKVEAFGSVRIVQQNRIGTGQHGVYYSKEGKIVLTGKPRVVQGKDEVTGKEITYYVNEDKSLVTGGTTPEERVIAVIHPKGKEEGKEKNDVRKP